MCVFCRALSTCVIDELSMCDDCASYWQSGHAEEMAQDLAVERAERKWDDPGYIYDLTHYSDYSDIAL